MTNSLLIASKTKLERMQMKVIQERNIAREDIIAYGLKKKDRTRTSLILHKP